MSERTFRPILSENDLRLISGAITVAVEGALDAAHESKDAGFMQVALERRAWAADMEARFERMLAGAKPKDTQVPGQMTVDEAMAELGRLLDEKLAADEFDARKAQAEAEEVFEEQVHDALNEEPNDKLDDFVASIRVEEPDPESMVAPV